MKKAVFIGRFQPFHRGHHQVVDEYREEYDLEIAIGSSEKEGTEENPLSFEERKKLIKSCYPDIEIKGIADEDSGEEGNRIWLQKVKDKTGAEIVISQNSLVKEIVRNDEELEIIEQDLYQEDIYSGTEVRRRVKSGEEWRYLLPDCCEKEFEKLTDKVKESGIQYSFEPGWKKENSYHDTLE